MSTPQDSLTRKRQKRKAALKQEAWKAAQASTKAAGAPAARKPKK